MTSAQGHARGPYPWGHLLAVLVASAGFLWAVLPYQLFWHDEGQFAQCAGRILAGELPHRDFDEPYTGGVSLWHAGGLLVFGRSFLSLRWAMLLAFLPAVPVLFDLLYRMLRRPTAAAAVTAGAVVCSVGMTHAPHANSYLLAVGIVGTWAAVRAALCDADRTRWFALAGLCGGVAVTVKVTGAYQLAAGGLALAAFGGAPGVRPGSGFGSSRTDRVAGGLVRLAAVLCGVGLLVPVLGGRPTPGVLAFFALPAGLVLAAVPVLEPDFDGRRFARAATAYGGAAAVPVGALLSVYWFADALPDLYRGLVTLPRMRAGGAAFSPPPGPAAALSATPPLLALLPHRGRRVRMVAAGGLLAFGGLLVAALHVDQPTYNFHPTLLRFYDAWRWLPAGLAAGVCVAAWRGGRFAGASPRRRRVCFAATAGAVFFHLHQYPWSEPLYVFHVLPLTVAAAASFATLGDPGGVDRGNTPARTAGSPAAMLTGVVLATAVFCLLRFGRDGAQAEFVPDVTDPDARPVVVSGLHTRGPDAADRLAVLAALRDLPAGTTILAGPDGPDLYFLTGRPNPTRLIYDFFSTSPDPAADLLRTAARPDVSAVVVNTDPPFSDPWPAAVVDRIAATCERTERHGRFRVLFKPPPRPAEVP